VNRGDLSAIITHDDPERLINTARTLADHLVGVGLTTSQIRNIFTTARQLQTKWLRPRESERGETLEKRRSARRQLVLLKPKLALQGKRIPAVQTLADWLEAAIDDVIAAENESIEYERFARFMEFFEAVLAYHTARGGRQEQRGR
jgi:CRISPR-associated protein Csm2